MQKNALFFEKIWKIAAALGAPLPNPRWPPAAGGSALSCYSYYLSQFFSRRRL